MHRMTVAALAMSACLTLAATGALGASTKPSTSEEWPVYAHDDGGSHFSPLAQIDRTNVQRLTVAWTYRTGALEPQSDYDKKATFEDTPLLVDGSLYVSTPFNHVIALDPQTGAKRWEFDPQVDRTLDYSEVTSRGIAMWLDTKAAVDAPCRRRVFVGTIDARLLALDAADGRPCSDFGDRGQVELEIGAGVGSPGDYEETS